LFFQFFEHWISKDTIAKKFLNELNGFDFLLNRLFAKKEAHHHHQKQVAGGQSESDSDSDSEMVTIAQAVLTKGTVTTGLKQTVEPQLKSKSDPQLYKEGQQQ